MRGRPAHFRVCVTKKWRKVRNLMVLDFTRELSVKLCRYCAHFLHLPFWSFFAFSDILLPFALNHFVLNILSVLIGYSSKPILLFLCFIWDTQKYIVKSVYSRRVTWFTYLVWKREIYYIFGLIYIIYLRKRFRFAYFDHI